MIYTEEDVRNFDDETRALERYKCKTDLFYLGTEYLGFNFVESVHRPVCDFFVKKDPDKPFEEQDVIHDRLLLDPREHYKTTIDVCDIVQWILVFPSIRIGIWSATERLAKQILAMAVRPFFFNEKFKALFEEHAESDKDEPGIFEWTTPGRETWFREPTLSISTIESASVGGHYEVLKFDDIIGHSNTKTAEAIQKVKDVVADLKPLVMAGGYRDFIGTRYDLSDAYGQIIDSVEHAQKTVTEIPFGTITVAEEETEQWKIFERTLCTLPLTRESTFLFPETDTGKKNFTFARAMKLLKDMGMYKFGCQYMNDPLWGQKNSFKEDDLRKATIPAAHIPLVVTNVMTGQKYQGATVYITVDMAFSEEKQADDTVIAVGAFDKLGRLFIIDLEYGKFGADVFLARFLTVVRRWQFFLARIGIEKAGGSQLILPALRMAGLSNIIGRIDWLKTSPKRTKWERVLGLLPLLKTGKFFFNKDLPVVEDIIRAFTRFPKGKVDIPDAISMMLEYQGLIDLWHPQLLEQALQAEAIKYEPNILGYGING